jgi:hypothetical protein
MRKAPSPGPFAERMMGLEPTTVCMAAGRSNGRPVAFPLNHRVHGQRASEAVGRNTVRIGPFWRVLGRESTLVPNERPDRAVRPANSLVSAAPFCGGRDGRLSRDRQRNLVRGRNDPRPHSRGRD